MGYGFQTIWHALLPACVLAAGAASAQSAGTIGGDDLAGTSDTAGVQRIGRVHEAQRRSARREVRIEILRDDNASWLKFKADLQETTGFDAAMDVSFLQQWGFAGGGSPALQIVPTPTNNWDLCKSTTLLL